MSKIIVTNKDNLIGKYKNEHKDYNYTKYEVTDRNDFSLCYVAFYEIEPSKANYPYHYHQFNSEVFYVISGNGLLKNPEKEIEISQGDIVVCPPGETGAHKIINTSTKDKFVYLDVSTTNSPDKVYYPDSNKIGIIKHNESSIFYINGKPVDYYEGE